MRPIAKEIQRGLREMERACASDGVTPETFTWKPNVGLAGLELPCVAGSIGRRVEIDAKGNPVEIDLTILVRREVIFESDEALAAVDAYLFQNDGTAGAPTSGALGTFRDRSMRVVGVKESGPRSHFEFLLKDEG